MQHRRSGPTQVVEVPPLSAPSGPPGGGYGLIVRDEEPQPRDGINQEANAYVFEAVALDQFAVQPTD